MPEAFKLKYINENGEEAQPIMIHRAIYGSFERFIAILCEHYEGKWPFWLSPFQVKILPINDKCISYANEIKYRLMEHKYHVKVDTSDLKLNKKVFNAQQEKYNYIIVIGNKEVKEQSLSVRRRSNNDSIESMTVDNFLLELKNKCELFQ